MPERVVSTESLTKYYGRVVGVRDLDLEITRGEVFGFLGPNGAGKTTTMRLLMGMLRPNGGHAEVFGLDAWKDSVAVRDKVGYLPGDAALYEKMTGDQHIRFVASFCKDAGVEDEGRSLAGRLELELGRKVGGFSKGMRQKLAIILAIMKKPPLLIMDEPTNALDPLT
ncbi:MAG: ABC transporter ATP-binding protein [Candidatus Geothermincolia bacterium]